MRPMDTATHADVCNMRMRAQTHAMQWRWGSLEVADWNAKPKTADLTLVTSGACRSLRMYRFNVCICVYETAYLMPVGNSMYARMHTVG
jgi:hypothetical protein